MAKLTLRDIVEQRLKQDGFDGLYDPDGECSCELGDLWPCECWSTDCLAGHYRPCLGASCEGGQMPHFHIGPKKELPGFKDIIGLFVDEKEQT